MSVSNAVKLRRLAKRARLAAYRGSNDREIELLQEALALAMRMLRIPAPDLTDAEIAKAEGWA